jgi:hypothetical protein
MRTTIPVLLLVLASSIVAVATACGDESAAGGSAPNGPEAGNAPIDGAPPPLPTGRGVTVTVVNYDAPVPDVRVVFHDATGAVTADHRTDANGKVTAPTAPPMLTVIFGGGLAPAPNYPTPGGAYVTYTSVAEGDSLVVEASPAPAEIAADIKNPVGHWNVTVPGAFTAATRHSALATRNCQGGSAVLPPPALDVILQPACLNAQNAILGTAENANGDILAFAWKKGLAAPATGQTTAVTLDQPWAGGVPFSLKATNIPAEGKTQGNFVLIADGASFPIRGNTTGEVGDGQGLRSIVPPPGFATAVQSSVYTEVEGDSADFAMFGVVKREPSASATTLDMAQALPRITSPAATLSASGRAEASWSSVAPLTTSDGGYVILGWSQPINATELAYFTWTFVVPPNATTVQAPAVPEDVASPKTDIDTATIAFVESSLVPGYKEWKAMPLPALRIDPGFDVGQALPSDATVRFSIAVQDTDTGL